MRAFNTASAIVCFVLLGSCVYESGAGEDCGGLPDEGCACEGGAEIPCYLPPEMNGDEVVCYAGTRHCEGGAWSACGDLHVSEVQAATAALITGPEPCNVCNPACFRSSDRPSDADLTPENSTNVESGPGGIRPSGSSMTTMGGAGPWEPTGDSTPGTDPCLASTLPFPHIGWADQQFVVPADTRFVRIKAWGGGGNTNNGRRNRGGPGGYTEALFQVTPTGEFREGSVHTVVAGSSAHCGGGWWRYGVGMRTGAGFSGVLRNPGGFWVDSWDRALVIAGGGGGGSRGNSHGFPGNGPGAGGSPNMGGRYGGDWCGGSGGGGYRGGAAGNRWTGGRGGTGFVHASAISQRMLASSRGSWDPPNTSDPDYARPWGSAERRGGVVVNFLCQQPCTTDAECVEVDHTCEMGACVPPPPPPPMGGGGDPLDDSEGLSVDPDGAIVLTPGTSEAFDNIWIANTGEGSISRFDIRSMRENGRFITGPFGGSGGSWGGGNDPSRTSINTAGHAFVGGRGSALLIRISPDGMDCPDTNGDGRITTSTSGAMLPWGQDDCVLWATDMRPHFPGRWMRAVAAQDIVDPATGDVREYVWVGGFNNQRLALVDGADGRVLMTTNIERPYGFALDGSGNLWISTISNRLMRVDTNRCNAAGCTSSICYEPSPTSSVCDGAVKQSIPMTFRNYGITVDFRQRVWMGNWSGNGDIWRYDPADNSWRNAPVRDWNYRTGIAADSLGNVWTTGGAGALRINADNPSIFQRWNGNAFRGWGVAIDAQDRAWIIDRWSNRAHVVTPGAAINSATWFDAAFSVRAPYTYSDMTGQQLRLAANPRGTYRHIFEGCATATVWDELQFTADTPASTFISFRVRTAATRAGLSAASYVTLGAAPATASPLNIAAAFVAAGVTPERFLQVEVTLVADTTDPTTYLTPRLLGLTALHHCSSLMPGTYERTYDANERCSIPREQAVWTDFAYISSVPAGTSIRFDVFTGTTAASVTMGSPSITIRVPPAPETDTIDLSARLRTAGIPETPPFVRIRATLTPDAASGAFPILAGWDIDYTCVPME